MKKIICMILCIFTITLTACDGNVDLSDANKLSFTNGNIVTIDDINIEKTNFLNGKILMQIFLDCEIESDFKLDVDLESLSGEEIDAILKKHREDSKSKIEKVTNDFLKVNLSNKKNLEIYIAKYSPLIELTYSNYDDFKKDLDFLNEMLLLDEVINIEIFI